MDVAQDCIVTEEDCGTRAASPCGRWPKRGESRCPLASGCLAGLPPRPSKAPGSDEILIPADSYLDEDMIDRLEGGQRAVDKVRSVLTCESKVGVCGACYGRDLARGTPVNIGEAVGVITAESIGEHGPPSPCGPSTLAGLCRWRNNRSSGPPTMAC